MTKPNCETIASVNLQRQGFEYYCPWFSQKIPNKKPIRRPLFPRYIFILIDKVWYSLQGTRGITRVLLGLDGPQTIPSDIIGALRAREGKDGLISLQPAPKFRSGQSVKASHGPLVGHALIYDGMLSHDRVRVLMELLGRKVCVEIKEKLLVAA